MVVGLIFTHGSRRTAACTRVGGALFALVLLALTAARASPATPAQPCPQLFGSFTAQSQPPGCWRPYGAASPFNKPIPSRVRVAADSSAIMHNLLNANVGFAGGKQNFQFDSQGSRPIY